MADEAVLQEIEAAFKRLPDEMITAAGGVMAQQQNYSDEAMRDALAEAMLIVENTLRTVADLWTRSKKRGWQSTSTGLLGTAKQLGEITAGLRTWTEGGEVAPAPSRGGPSVPYEWCGNTDVHPSHGWTRDGGGLAADARRQCGGRSEPRDSSGLDALIADAKRRDAARVLTVPFPDNGCTHGEGCPVHPDASGLHNFDGEPSQAIRAEDLPVTVGPGVHFLSVPLHETADGNLTSDPIPGPEVTGLQLEAELRESAKRVDPPPAVDPVTAYLTGESNVLPELDHRQYATALDAAQEQVPAPELWADPFVDPTPRPPIDWSQQRCGTPTVSADGYRLPGAAAVDPFVDPGGIASRSRSLSWADLRKPAPGAAPEHLSHSQVETLSDCGLKYRLQRLEPGVTQMPQWALVGGKAFHAAVEAFELTIHGLGGAVPSLEGYDVQLVWRHHFDAAIRAERDASGIDQSQWRASKSGAEGYTWWLINGEEMYRTYLQQRAAQDGRRLLMIGDKPCLEHEGVMPVEGETFKLIIDSAWVEADGTITIDDYKTGDRMPYTTDQLGEYAQYLVQELDLQPDAIVRGRYYNARKGVYTAPIEDLLAKHPYDELAYRVESAAAQKAAGVYAPRPSTFCGGCSVKHACPVMAARISG